MYRQLPRVVLALTGRRFSAILFLTLSAAACGDHGPVAPTPTATPGGTSSGVVPTGGELIKGTVYDSALRPLAGARVELLDGPQAGRSATAAANGEFSLTGTVDDTTRFRASKEGHVTATATILPNCDRCNPRRWVHFYLNLLVPPAAIAGDYSLTFVADSACANLPGELRTRTYAVTVAPADLNWPGYPALSGTSYKVTPQGSTFSDVLNLFYLNVAGNHVNVSLGDHTDPGITERVAPNAYFAFGGWAFVSVETPVSTKHQLLLTRR